MAGGTSRRGFGARAVLLVAVIGLLIAPLSGSALDAPGLVNTSFTNLWAGPTDLVAEGHITPGGRAFDPDDPPYKWSDGEIRFLLTRWTKAICDGSRPDDILPTFTVTERDDPDHAGDGLALNGIVSIEDFNSSTGITQPDRVLRFSLFDANGDPTDVAYPRGLAAGRDFDETQAVGADRDGDTIADNIQGGGAPFTVAITVYHRNPNGTCNHTPATTSTQIGIDRELPSATITKPARATGMARRNIGTGCKQFDPANFGVCTDTVNIAAPQSGAVLVEGVATDPRTKPDSEDGNDYGFLETSGVAAVVVRLYSSSAFGSCGSSSFGGCPGAFIKSYTVTNPDCALPYVIPGTTITRCSESFNFSVDVTADLTPGAWYAVDVVAIDRAGFRSPVSSSQPWNPDNTAAPETNSVAFLFQG